MARPVVSCLAVFSVEHIVVTARSGINNVVVHDVEHETGCTALHVGRKIEFDKKQANSVQ